MEEADQVLTDSLSYIRESDSKRKIVYSEKNVVKAAAD